MRALVTGAAGFIGSHLCRKLLDDNATVFGVDNFSNSSPSKFELLSIQPSFEGAEVDCLHIEKLDKVFEWFKPEVVFHQAALGSIPRSLAEPFRTLQNNTFAMHNVLESCRKHKVKRVVFASSSSVYGLNPKLVKRESEIMPALNPYALSKQWNEMQADTWARAYGVQYVGLRYFNVFGPGQNPEGEYAAVIPRWIRCILTGEPITIYGTGNQLRDFTYIDNAVAANILAMNAPDHAVNFCYNVGGGNGVALVVLLEEMAKIATEMGYKMPEIKREKGRPNEVQGTSADLSTVKNYLGYATPVHWREGLRKTCERELRR